MSVIAHGRGDVQTAVKLATLAAQAANVAETLDSDMQVGHSDNTLFPMVNTETEYGVKNKVKMRLPIFTGALGSTEIARKNWEHFAAGAAISGITLVCGENVCGIDPGPRARRQGQGDQVPRHGRARGPVPPLP